MRLVRGEAGVAALAALLAVAGAVLALRLWDASLGAPFEYFGDVNLQHLLVQATLEGWPLENDRLGAPHGLELYDYPVANGDTLNLVVVWILGLFGAGSAAAMNVLYVLTFPAAGVAAYLVLRRLGAERWAALVCAVLYALLPYHFIRGETHLFLSAYYAVPVGAYLALAVVAGEELLGRWRRTVITAALAALVAVASGSFYYSAFTVVLVGVAALLRWLVVRDRRPLFAGGFVVGAIVAVSLLQLLPTIVYRVQHGTNEQVAQRYTFESEVYGLKLTQLVLPLDGHRVDALARAKQRYSERFPPGDARAATLGVVAVAGLAWLFGVALAAIVGRRASGRHLELSALTLTAFLLATVGGLGTVLGVFWSQTRAWNRLSIFIAFFALAAVALGLSWLGRRMRAAVFGAVAVAVLVVGFLDQTSSAFVPNYAGAKGEWDHDRAFFAGLEGALPAGAMVVQLPYEPFPEPAPGRQALYEPVKPFLHTEDLRWSYGGMRGRDDWAATIADKPAAEIVSAARAEGFAGILVDRLGYPDDGAAMEAELRTALSAEPERSPNGRWLFWPLEAK